MSATSPAPVDSGNGGCCTPGERGATKDIFCTGPPGASDPANSRFVPTNATSSAANSQMPWRRVTVSSSRSISQAIPRHRPSTAADVSSVTDSSPIIATRAAVPPRTAVDRSLPREQYRGDADEHQHRDVLVRSEAPDVERVVAVPEVGLADAEAEHAGARQQHRRDGQHRHVNRLPPGGEQREAGRRGRSARTSRRARATSASEPLMTSAENTCSIDASTSPEKW